MSSPLQEPLPERPPHVAEQPLPPMPDVDQVADSGVASVQLSKHRTRLSTHRTGLSEHRTQLSEHRTDLSTYRTHLSTRRTTMSTQRTEMSMRRTGMSFQRTRMSAERTLMSVVRTSLSLISFGFTIFQVFQKMGEQGVLAGSTTARNFGVTLLLLGVAMLAIGMVYHVMFMRGLRDQRNAMTADGLIHGQSGFPPSTTLITAGVLLLLGLAATANVLFHVDVFG
jgi:uncharacterized membrane protein YidH (DUF202 family)